MWQGDITFELSWRGTPEAEATFRGQLVIMRMKGQQTILGGCCTRCMLHMVYAILGANTWSWHGQIESNDLTLCSAMIVELWTRKRGMGDEDENDMEDYERIWEIRGMTCLIGLGWSLLIVITHLIGTRICCIRDHQLTRTRNSRKSQFLMMISPVPFHISLSCPQFYHHLRTRS